MNNGRGFWDASVAMTTSAQQWHKAAAITSPYESNPLALTLFVSCYNQETSVIATLDTMIEALRAIDLSYEIIVIDDGSRDRSVELLRRYAEAHSGINLVLRANKEHKGLAQNYIDAAFIGRGKYYRHISGNNAEPMETMIDVLKAIGEADIIVPYYITSMQEGVPQQLAALSYTWFLNLTTGNRINDYNSSHVHLRFNVMRWHSGLSLGFRTSLLCRLLQLGFTCKQVPCRTTHRRGVTWKDLLSLPAILLDVVLRRVFTWIETR